MQKRGAEYGINGRHNNYNNHLCYYYHYLFSWQEWSKMKDYVRVKRNLLKQKYKGRKLEDQKSELWLQAYKITSSISQTPSSVSHTDADKLSSIMYMIEELDKKINLNKKVVDNILIQLNHLEDDLRQSLDIETRIFVMRFIDHNNYRYIARKIPCSYSQVYRIFDKLNTELKLGRNEKL